MEHIKLEQRLKLEEDDLLALVRHWGEEVKRVRIVLEYRKEDYEPDVQIQTS